MAMVATYHDTSYIGQACASTISTMRYALMDHCVHSARVTLYRLMACSSYAHSMHLQARELQSLHALIEGYYRANTKRPIAQAHAIKGPKGPQKSVLGLGSHG